MKRVFTLLVFVLTGIFMLVLQARADNDKPITVGQLPATARQIVKKHFAGKKVAMAKMETGFLEKSYEVVFTNGDKIEFDRNGSWTEVVSKGNVPAALVPAAIRNYLKQNYPGQSVVKIEKDGRDYEVKLSGGLEITFNKNFKVTDID